MKLWDALRHWISPRPPPEPPALPLPRVAPERFDLMAPLESLAEKKPAMAAEPEESIPFHPGSFQEGILEASQALSPRDRQRVEQFCQSHECRFGGWQLPPAAAVDVMRLVDNPKTTIQGLAEAMERDPALAGAVLRLANSPLYRGAFEVHSLRVAVVRLGLRNLRMLLLTVVLNSTRVKGKPYQSICELTFKHSLLSARLAEGLAPRVGLDPDQAYMAGLFHNVGVFALMNKLRKWALDREARVSSRAAVELIRRFAYDTNKVVIKQWNLPESIAEAATGYRSPPDLESTPRLAVLTRLVNDLSKHYGIWVAQERQDFARSVPLRTLGLRPFELPERAAIYEMAESVAAQADPASGRASALSHVAPLP